MKSLFLPLFLLVSQPLLACTVNVLHITPPRPTVADDIEVALSGSCPDGCIPHSPRVRVEAGRITIDLDRFDGCILIPQPWGERVSVGRVPAGSYEVIVNRDGVEMTRQALTVRDHPFTLRPSFGDASIAVLIGLKDLGTCPTLACGAPSVTFGGVPATSVVPGPDGIVVRVPHHTPGLVDVVVTNHEGTKITAVAAFLYPAPQADLSGEHERVLFPSVFAGPGAHGSEWTSDNFVLNASPVPVWTIPALVTDTVCTLGCPPRAQQAFEEARLPHTARDGGMFVSVPRGLEESFVYGSHIVDRSRRQTDAGTEMRVVHEQEGGPDLILLNVPLTAESRQTLRIFDLDAVERDVEVQVLVPGRNPVSFGVTLGHRIVCVTTPCYPEHPTYTTLSLDAMPSLNGLGNARIRIRARTNEARLWAFVSVTNNDTQHVTAVTPQHRPR